MHSRFHTLSRGVIFLWIQGCKISKLVTRPSCPQFLSEMLYIIKVLHKLSKLLLALHNILLTNASGQVKFYTPGIDCQELKMLNFLMLFSFCSQMKCWLWSLEFTDCKKSKQQDADQSDLGLHYLSLIDVLTFSTLITCQKAGKGLCLWAVLLLKLFHNFLAWLFLLVFCILHAGIQKVLSEGVQIFFSWWGDRGSKCHYKWAIICLPAKRHLNGVLLAGQLWPNIEFWLGRFVIFQGIQTSIAMKPYIFVIFRGGGGPDPCALLWIGTWI